jgi:hypothetical protein
MKLLINFFYLCISIALLILFAADLSLFLSGNDFLIDRKFNIPFIDISGIVLTTTSIFISIRKLVSTASEVEFPEIEELPFRVEFHDFMSAVARKAIKEHECWVSGRKIEKGETYINYKFRYSARLFSIAISSENYNEWLEDNMPTDSERSLPSYIFIED